MQQWIKKSLKVLMALGIGGLIIWLSMRDLSTKDIDEILDALKQTNYIWIIASLLVAFISNISRTMRWQQLLEPMGYKPPFINVMLSVLVAYFANLGLPRLGEVARCGLLKTYNNIPIEKSLGTVVTERALDLLIFALLFVFNFFIQFERIHHYVEEEIFSQWSFNPSLLLYVAIGVFFIVLLVYFSFRKQIKAHRLYQKIAHLVQGFLAGLKSITQVKNPWLLVFHSLFIWLCYWMMAYLIFQSIPLQQPLGMMEAFSALTIGTIGMIVVQGGLGIYPLLVAGTLVSYGLSYPTGYALGWLMWSSQTLGIIICGVISLIVIPQLNRQNTNPNR